MVIGREIPEELAARVDQSNEFPMEMWQKLGSAGYAGPDRHCWKLDSLIVSFLGITAEEDYGGLAMGYQAHCIVMEEISRRSGRYYFTSWRYSAFVDLVR